MQTGWVELIARDEMGIRIYRCMHLQCHLGGILVMVNWLKILLVGFLLICFNTLPIIIGIKDNFPIPSNPIYRMFHLGATLTHSSSDDHVHSFNTKIDYGIPA